MAVTSWDTLFIAGGDSVNDTLFARPHRLAVVDDLVIVADGMTNRVIALDKHSGEVRWTFGRQGSGPGEFMGITDIKRTRDGVLWILDYWNGRVTELSPDGQFVGIKTLTHLPAPPSAILPLGDRAIAMSPGGSARPFMELTGGSLEMRNRFSLAWPESVPELANTGVSLAEGPGSEWVSAFELGPGFTVWEGDSPHSYRYIDNIPFANKVGPAVRKAGADSARYGAVSLSIVGNEIFMLFGGRPVRSAHPGEPTIWIDVYSLKGVYERSYLLPFNANAMATDGITFYLIVSDVVPRLIALRPAEGPTVVQDSPCDSALMARPSPTPVTTPPTIMRRAEAMRSIEQAARETGGVPAGATALVWFLIDKDGNVAAAQIAKTADSESADTAALRSARSFRFNPGLYNGDRVCVWIRLPIIFTSGSSTP